jgi:hypothetical protein
MSTALLTSNNTDYHANRSHLSSSNLKMILQDIAQFKREWIDGLKEPEADKSYLVEGTLTHSLILEPGTVSKYAIFPGLRKAGKEWEAFKAANAHRPIVSIVQMQRAEKLYRAYAAMQTATAMIQGGLAEHTMLGNIMGVDLKSRADYIVPGQYIVDVKTTSLPSGSDFFAETITQYEYGLSAALYTEIADQTYKAKHDFYWLVLSKDDGQCHIYKAGPSLVTGKLLVHAALAKYKQCLATGLWVDDQAKQDFDTADYEIEAL